MAEEGLIGLVKLKAKIDRLPAAVRKAGGQEAFMQAEELAATMRMMAPRGAADGTGQKTADHIHVEEGRLGDVSYVVTSDAKDADGKPKAAHVELGHRAKDGTHVPGAPYFYRTVRAKQKSIKRRIKSAMRRAIKAEAKR